MLFFRIHRRRVNLHRAASPMAAGRFYSGANLIWNIIIIIIAGCPTHLQEGVGVEGLGVELNCRREMVGAKRLSL
jgi:hypothetical protein